MVFGLVIGMFGVGVNQCSAHVTEAMAVGRIKQAVTDRIAVGESMLQIQPLRTQCEDARNGGEYTASVFQAIDDAVARAQAQNVPFGTWYRWKVAMLARVTAADAVRDSALDSEFYAEDRHGLGRSYLFSAGYKRDYAPSWYTWQEVYSDASAAISLFDSALDDTNDAIINFADARNLYNGIKSDADASF